MITDNIARVPADAVPEGFTRPSSSYKRQAWVAFIGLGLFAAFYAGLTAWFAITAYRHIYGATATNRPEYNIFAGIMAGLLAVFMAKAMFFVRRGQLGNVVEVRREEEPELFAFIEGVADSVKAPRPHKVFFSPEVNASVSYDLSPINLIIPTRKNLIIGLGLVNSLNAAEFKAVLAHEFGHFSQRTMAVGRWVYIGQQIAGHIIAKRDAFDALVSALCRIDLRVAWIGWILSVIIWSIRAVTETVFRWVMLAQRALSREMEFNADLVAVSVTGSDHLVNGLHRMGAADGAWSDAIGFLNRQFERKWMIEDVYAVHARIVERTRLMRGDPGWGATPPAAPGDAASHRVFDEEAGHPHGMWMSHPPHREREENAKRTYIPSAAESRDAWSIFTRAAEWRRKMTASLYTDIKRPDSVLQSGPDTLRDVDARFEREALAPEHLGIYHDRPLFRAFATANEIIDPTAFAYHTLDAARPESLVDTLKRWRKAEEELARLRLFKPETALLPGGGVRHRGRLVRSRELPALIAELTKETEDLRAQIARHDRLCRSVHHGAAVSVGGGWDAYLVALIGVIHYAEHAMLNLHDAHRAFLETLAQVTARGRVSDDGRNRLISAASDLYRAMQGIERDRDGVCLDTGLANRLGKPTWSELLEPFRLGSFSLENAPSWIANVDGWVASQSSSLEKLRDAALDRLLESEKKVAELYVREVRTEDAPTPPSVPKQYPVLPYGKERGEPAEPGIWDSFMGSDSFAWSGLRTGIAASLILALVGFAGTTTASKLHVFNGLACRTVVAIDGKEISMAPGAHRVVELSDKAPHVRTTTESGELIEEFDGEQGRPFGDAVYNVANGGLLLEYYVYYGNGTPRPPNFLGAPRWYHSNANHIFEEPPRSISSSGAQEHSVFIAKGDIRPGQLCELAGSHVDSAILAHARYDAGDAENTPEWLALAIQSRGAKVLADRLKNNPKEIISLRLEQEVADPAEWPKVAGRHKALSAANPGDPDLLYIAIRAQRDNQAEQDAAFIAAHAKYPDHGWLAYAAGYSLARAGRFVEAVNAYDVAIKKNRQLRDQAAMESARVSRLAAVGSPDLAALAAKSRQLKFILELESPAVTADTPAFDRALKALHSGDITSALKNATGAGGMENEIMILAAASEGAPAALTERALAIPVEKITGPASVPYAMALAFRAGRDVAPYGARLGKMYGRNDADLCAVFADLRNHPDLMAVEQKIETLDLHSRGLAYAFGVIVLGDRTPARWRERANRLLFVHEKPYFR